MMDDTENSRPPPRTCLRGILSIALALPLLAPPARADARTNGCAAIFIPRATGLVEARNLGRAVALDVEKGLVQDGGGAPQKRGYAVLVAAMVGSAAVSTYLGSHLTSHFQFLSVFVSQVSTLGVYMFGAPIWEPLSSKFRKLAFTVKGDSSLGGRIGDPHLEALWHGTQENYGLNEQMSRNVLNQFIVAVRQNFYEAYRAHASPDQGYSADQVAEAAYRLKVLFREIPPDDPSVTASIRSAFTDHVVVDTRYVALVRSKIAGLDPDFDSAETRAYYREVLRAWLPPAPLTAPRTGRWPHPR